MMKVLEYAVMGTLCFRNKPCMQVMLWKPQGGVEDIMAGVEAATKASEAVKNPPLAVQVTEDREMKKTPTPSL
jgi:hypothetical protein